jgi:hypothetical protein
MKRFWAFAGVSALGLLALGSSAPRVCAQDPIITPIIAGEVAGEVAPIVAKVITPKPKQPAGTIKFEGFYLNGNSVQVTLRARGDDKSIQTFALTEDTSAKMQKIIDNGGYQYGDKVIVYYDPQTRKAIKFRGKPSRPL